MRVWGRPGRERDSGRIRIRPAGMSDVARLAAIGLAAWLDGIGPLVPAAVRRRMRRANPFHPFIKGNLEAILLASLDGEIAGFAGLEYRDDYLSDLWVDPACARRGVGTALLRAAEALVEARGYPSIRLQVMRDNLPAVAFYRRNGFAVAWRGERLDPMLGVTVAKLGMRKRLDQP